MTAHRSYAAGQAFLLCAKTFWTRQVYPALREEYEAAIAAGARPQRVEEAEAVLADSVLYHYFAWLERHLQRMKYSGRYGLQPWHAQQRERLEAELARSVSHLQLAENVSYPGYYTEVDIHQHPGGVWSDPVAGFVYERGARTTTPLAGQKHKDLHERLASVALKAGTRPQRVLDMGCGFGKSTRPFYEALPDAHIEAIDLSAPCLRLAAHHAARAGASNVAFRQLDASATDYADESFDLVTSTMLLHEMPPQVVQQTLSEAARILKPGGRMLHLDFLPGPDAFDQLIHFGHGRRNNEPFMEPLAKMALEDKLRGAGFRDVRIERFEEADGALDPAYRNWRFPWTLISARR